MSKPTAKTVTSLIHDDATRRNIPSAELAAVMTDADKTVKTLRYPRNPDLDPQLVWRGKDAQDGEDLRVKVPPLYIQEKIHPQALIDDLKQESARREQEAIDATPDLFADFNGLPHGVDKTEFYRHEQHWANRMILGDSLQAMASLAEREGLRGKVQCIYFDPPYGIKFNSNFQWSTSSRDVKDGNAAHITREPEQVRAFRDTWRDGIHSYLSYIRDRLTVARDLLSDSGSVFVQIGDENVHRIRAVMDEVFGDDNFVSLIQFTKTGLQASALLSSGIDYIVWFAKDKKIVKYRQIYLPKKPGEKGATGYVYLQEENGIIRSLTKEEKNNLSSIPDTAKVLDGTPLISAGSGAEESNSFRWYDQFFNVPKNNHWKTTQQGMERLVLADRIVKLGNRPEFKKYLNDFCATAIDNVWISGGERGFTGQKLYVVQTATDVIERCLLMTTDPGDLVLDPTCGSGTTAYVAEQWGRRWITIDTSRVALALARARLMGARYPYYLLADSAAGRRKEAELSGRAYTEQPTFNRVRQGFVYERVPHVTLKSIANNAEIDVIWENWQATLEPLREALNAALGQHWQEWEIPRELEENWPEAAQKLHAEWWRTRIKRQQEIDASIARKAEFETLYDKPYEDKKTVRVAGPFTVETLSLHRMLGVDENGGVIDPLDALAHPDGGANTAAIQSFEQMILENLRMAGVQQTNKADRIRFESLEGWPGRAIGLEGRYIEASSGLEKRAGILIGPEFGTVTREDLVDAAREAGEARFDVLIALAFSYDAHASELDRLGKIPILKARMNADLHMGENLKPNGQGNLFVIFGEPDVELLRKADDMYRVRIRGVDVFDPGTGQVRSDETDGIACWMLDTDYDNESFFVRHAYFLGQNDPYKALKVTLKAEIDQAAWSSLKSDTSRPFPRPATGRIAVKVINHLGDEVMKVMRV
jgi:adenine-specific DNA-methyltransferase